MMSVSRPSRGLFFYFFNNKTALNALVCDHSPVYFAIKGKFRDKFLLKAGSSVLDFLTVGELANSRKILSCGAL